MLWDVRVWSFFMWLVGTSLYLAAFATPFFMPGNRIGVIVAFGGNVDPDGPKLGLWKDIPSELSGIFLGVQITSAIGVALILLTLIGYILLFKRSNTVAQVVSVVGQILAGVFGLIAIIIFRVASDQMGEGFWMMALSSALFIVNGIVLTFMPFMEYQVPKWKTAEDVPLTANV